MFIKGVRSADEPERIGYELRRDGSAIAYLRDNIKESTDEGGGFVYDEVQVICGCSKADVESKFDEIWERESLTDSQRIANLKEDTTELADTVLALCDIIEGGEE